MLCFEKETIESQGWFISRGSPVFSDIWFLMTAAHLKLYLPNALNG
jgi:hypothetical protein